MAKVVCWAIELTEEQMEELAQPLLKVHEAAMAGVPGMLLAQIIGSQAKVFFATMDQAQKVQAAMDSKVGLTTRDLGL